MVQHKTATCKNSNGLKMNCQCCFESEREAVYHLERLRSVLGVQKCTCLPHLQPMGPSLHLKK